MMDIKALSNDELIALYSSAIGELKQRNIIRTANVVGDLGEFIAIQYYCNTKGLPKLQAAPPGTKNVDALSVDGERYSIKTTTGHVTGVFFGLNSLGSNEPDTQKFEYVIIVMLGENLSLNRINELTWEQFIHHKKWHSRMRAWNLSITQSVLNNSKTIFQR